jgi:hypothetical protein
MLIGYVGTYRDAVKEILRLEKILAIKDTEIARLTALIEEKDRKTFDMLVEACSQAIEAFEHEVPLNNPAIVRLRTALVKAGVEE